MMKQKKWITILLFAGSITLFAFPPFNQIYILFIVYALLFYSLWITSSWRQAVFYGFSFGITHFLFGLYWIFSVLDEYTFSSKIIMVTVLIVTFIFYASHFALIGYFSFKIKHKITQLSWFMILLPLLTTCMEWLRSWIDLGFTWLSPADTLIDLGFSPLYPFIGSLGVGFVFYMIIGLAVYTWIHRSKQNIMFFIIGIILFIFTLSMLEKYSHTSPLDKHLSVQILQTHFTNADKTQRYKVVKRVKAYQELTLAAKNIDLAIYPESTVSVEYEEVFRHLEKGFKELIRQGTEVLYGAYKMTPSGVSNVLIKGDEGKVIYTKQHLVPFGEYTPSFLSILDTILPEFYMGDMIKIKTDLVSTIKDVKIAPTICYELLFSEEMVVGMGEANLLLNISDLGWFDHAVAEKYLLNVARVRSLESQKPMIYVVNEGESAFISYRGEILKKATQTNKTESIQQNVVPREGLTPYTRYGNAPLYSCGFLLILFLFREYKTNTKEINEKNTAIYSIGSYNIWNLSLSNSRKYIS